MTGSKWIVAALMSGALMAFAPSAWAEPTAPEKEHARELMAEGRDKRDRSDLAGALTAFQQADNIMHVPTTAFEVAKTQQQIGKLVEARETCDAIAKLPAQPNEPPPFTEARAKADALGKELDQKIGTLKLAVHASDASLTAAVVTIDDVAVANADVPVKVNPGKHVVAAKAGDASAKLDIVVAPGESKDIALNLERHGGGGTASTTPEASSGPKLPLPMLSLVGFGVGVAGLAVGTIWGVMAMGDESDISKACHNTHQCSPSVSDSLDSAKTKATISTVGFIVAGVGIAVGVVGLFVPLKTETKVGALTVDLSKLRATF